VKYYRQCFLLVFLFCAGIVGAQRVLSIEEKHEVKTIKVYEGQEIEYKLLGSDEWYTDEVKQFFVSDSTILFENSMIHLRNLASIRFDNYVAKGISKTLMTFGAAWLMYGGIAHASGRFKFNWGTFAIGTTALGVGILTNKVAGRKTFRAGQNANFKLLDLNFIESNP
jgi:hypothetical protein